MEQIFNQGRSEDAGQRQGRVILWVCTYLESQRQATRDSWRNCEKNVLLRTEPVEDSVFSDSLSF